MEQGKHSYSDSSSAENDPQPEKSNEDNTGIGRSYECAYCKRGFTNAQALGGHMNIHRKDKAKAKQKTNHQEESSVLKNENYMNSRYFPQIPTPHDQYNQQQAGYYRLMETQMSYQVYLPSTNPNFQIGNSESNFPFWRRPEHFDRMDENLSLSIGLTPPSVEDGDENAQKDEVDLELRLGHDP